MKTEKETRVGRPIIVEAEETQNWQNGRLSFEEFILRSENPVGVVQAFARLHQSIMFGVKYTSNRCGEMFIEPTTPEEIQAEKEVEEWLADFRRETDVDDEISVYFYDLDDLEDC